MGVSEEWGVMRSGGGEEWGVGRSGGGEEWDAVGKGWLFHVLQTSGFF